MTRKEILISFWQEVIKCWAVPPSGSFDGDRSDRVLAEALRLLEEASDE